MSEYKFTISEKHNSFVWFPPRSSTHTFSWIFGHFNFRIYYSTSDGVLDVLDSYSNHLGHFYFYPPNHMNMTFICTTRNPYERVFSFFKLGRYNFHRVRLGYATKPTKMEFENFYTDLVTKQLHIYRPIFDKRKPDYVVRNENMYEDLKKIPFVRDSKLNNCGILEEMCESTFNRSPTLDINEFIDQEMRERIYQDFKEEFEIGNYPK